MNIPENLRYTKSHEWVRLEEDGSMTFGITDHAQDALGDIVFVEPPAEGDEFAAGDECGVVESTKAASDIYAPIEGVVAEANADLDDEPGLMNSDPYTKGWFARLTPANPADFEALLSAADYKALLHK